LERALAPDFTPGEISFFLKWWVKRSIYLEALAAGKSRVGLDGSTADVEPTHASYAAVQLEGLKKRRLQAA
jgi:sRNA-binding protein